VPQDQTLKGEQDDERHATMKGTTVSPRFHWVIGRMDMLSISKRSNDTATVSRPTPRTSTSMAASMVVLRPGRSDRVMKATAA